MAHFLFLFCKEMATEFYLACSVGVQEVSDLNNRLREMSS